MATRYTGVLVDLICGDKSYFMNCSSCNNYLWTPFFDGMDVKNLPKFNEVYWVTYDTEKIIRGYYNGMGWYFANPINGVFIPNVIAFKPIKIKPYKA